MSESDVDATSQGMLINNVVELTAMTVYPAL